MNDDAALLRRYAEERDEAAFAELVQRHLALVYGAALRQLAGSAHRAEEVTQSVFTDLARKAGPLARRTNLAGWLYTSTHFAAAKLKRTEQRRQMREQEAHIMHELLSGSSTDADWEQLRPVLDDAVHELGDRDREVILQRFFQGRRLAEVGERLGLSEDAARMRVDRAIEKLRALLAKRQITSTTAALAVVLANQPAVAVPVSLAASVTTSALASASVAAPAVSIFQIMSTTKITLGVAGAIAVAATAVIWQQRQTDAELRNEIGALRQQTAATAILRAENAQLLAEKNSRAETTRAEHEELVQLRVARDAFRQRLAQGAANPPVTKIMGGDPSASASPPDMVPIDLVAKKSGQDTPVDTARTLMWYLHGGDIKHAADLLAFEPAEKSRLKDFIATLPENIQNQYGTPAKLIAFVMAGSPKPLAGVQVLSETHPDDYTSIQNVRLQYQSGETREDEIKFHRDPDGWKQVVSPATVDRAIGYLKPKR